MKEPGSVIAKTMVVDESPNKVLEFFLNPPNWEHGGALENIHQIDKEWWGADTPFGLAKLRLRPLKEFGIFDHDFVGGGGEWTVFCRVTPNGRGSTTSWLFIKPDGMPHEQFESQLKNFDKEMDGWKKAIEAKAS